jgi:AcrR family transcriptional regulator
MKKSRARPLPAPSATKRPARSPRLASGARRLQLLRVAADLVLERGVEGLQLTDLARAAGVSRPIVYRFFENRHALVVALLEDFQAALTARFAEAGGGVSRSPIARSAPMARVTRLFIDAICDTIEERGMAGWHLLDSRGPDPEVARAGAAIQERLVAPWLPLVAERTGATPREVQVLARMIVAAGRAVLELWYGGSITRDEAVRDATRGVSALLEAFGKKRTRARARG